MKDERDRFWGFLLLLAAAFFVPEGLSIAFGLEEAHARLVTWAAEKTGPVFAALVCLYVLFGLGVLALGFLLAFSMVRIAAMAAVLAAAFVAEKTALLARGVLCLCREGLRWTLGRLLGRGIGDPSTCRHRRTDRKDAGPPFDDAGSLALARRVLGLPEDFTRQAFEIRYRTLMKGVHPDVAGPNDLARQLNEARDTIRRARAWR